MILYNLLCFTSVPVFIFGGTARKVAGINYHNPVTESCHELKFVLEQAFLSKKCLCAPWEKRWPFVSVLLPPAGHSITKHTGGGLARRSESKTPKYLSKNSNILKILKSYPLNILKVQSESSKIINLEQIFIFPENYTPNYP